MGESSFVIQDSGTATVRATATGEAAATAFGIISAKMKSMMVEKMTAEQRQVLFENTARAIDGASEATIERHIANCTKADPAYGEGVRKAIEALQAGKLSATDVNTDSA